MQENPQTFVPAPSLRKDIPLRAPFGGLLIAALLLSLVEAILHTDAFLYRYRAVFAAGRVMDKLLAVETFPPTLLVLGNSRVDNGFSPDVLRRETGTDAFNLGIPGADACNVDGLVARLVDRGVFEKGRTEQVLIGLDDGFLQRGGGLGYAVFFDDRARLLQQGRYADWARSWFRLWGYAGSLRTLQEPANFIRFLKATTDEVESWGGSARVTGGFRAADEVVNQNAEQIAEQRAAKRRPPDPAMLECFWAMTEILQARGVNVRLFFTPALGRTNAFAGNAGGAGTPYSSLKTAFIRRGLQIVDFDVSSVLEGSYFANPGHLNRAGAARYTALLSGHLDSTTRVEQGN